jgi:glycosyltransferase involved in cell wall biosynthesis
MRVAIVHYHLRPGGVTRVIETAARVLAAAGVEVVVLTGEEALESCAGPDVLATGGADSVPNPDAIGMGRDRLSERSARMAGEWEDHEPAFRRSHWLVHSPTTRRTVTENGPCHHPSQGIKVAGLGMLPAARVREVAGLGYLRDAGELTAAGLAAALRAAAGEALGGAPDIWHFHNPALGKNVLLGDVVAILAEAGERLALQIHDLVEDGRPANHALIASCRRLYPVGPGIGYVFVNSRDQRRFCQSGLPAAATTLLPNPVSRPQPRAGKGSAARPLVLYPVRGIRRKNLGEVLLLAALAPAGVRFAVTAAPVEAEWQGIHEAWQACARQCGLPVELAVVGRLAPAPGAAPTFDAWLDHATHLLTTSVAEGFGFALLDALALGKPLLGRKLSHLAADHAAEGVELRGLYDRMLVPAEVVAAAELENDLRAALAATYRGYGREVSEAEVERALAAITAGGWLDFGNLPEGQQRELIGKIAADPAAFGVWLEIDGSRIAAAAWLAECFQRQALPVTPGSDGPQPAADGGDCLAPWSEVTYQARLLALYAMLAAQPAAGLDYLDRGRLLDLCLRPEMFHFLCGQRVH